MNVPIRQDGKTNWQFTEGLPAWNLCGTSPLFGSLATVAQWYHTVRVPPGNHSCCIGLPCQCGRLVPYNTFKKGFQGKFRPKGSQSGQLSVRVDTKLTLNPRGGGWTH